VHKTLGWLVSPAAPGSQKNIDVLLGGISQQLVRSLDMSLHAEDSLYSELFKEVENGRVARLMMKLAMISDRENVAGEQQWGDNDVRYQLRLFRDYVFHSVDENGNPVIDMGHMLRALAKLDAGTNEMVRLSSRDGETDFIVSYKDLNKMVSISFGALVKASRQNSGGL